MQLIILFLLRGCLKNVYMKTINSLSGGKTSSYLAVHYPADYNIFSLVRIEDKRCTQKDLKLVQLISDKIGM